MNAISITPAQRLKGAVFGFALADALSMPFKGYKPAEVSHLSLENGFIPRLGNEFMAHLPPGYTTRETEALIAILKSSPQLPDLLHFAFNLKAAFTTFPEKWKHGTVFPWPPFPDKSHFTLSFSIPAAYKLANKDVDNDQIVYWILRLSPSSAIWQQCIFVFTRILAALMSGETTHLNVWQRADELAQEAESIFPGASLLDPFMNSVEALGTDYTADARFKDGMVDHAHAALGMAILAFSKGGDSLQKTVEPLVLLGGDTGAVCYAGAFWGAQHGFDALPKALIERIPDAIRLESGTNNVLSKLA